MNARTLLPALAAMLSLVACSGILPKAQPFDIYQLGGARDTVRAASAGASESWQLRVDKPDAPRMLSGSRIVVVPEGNRVSVYGGARWADTAPTLLRDRLIDAFRADGRVPMVSSDDDGLGTDYELGSRLDAFQAEYRGGDRPVVVVRLDAWLLPAGDARPSANRRFEVTEAADGSDVAAVVAAFGRAADTLAEEIVAWTLGAADATR